MPELLAAQPVDNKGGDAAAPAQRCTTGFDSSANRYGSLLSTLGAGVSVQLLSSAAGLAVLPVIVRALGTSRFGVFVVVVSLGPWLTLVDGALYPATRLLVGESRRPGTVAANSTLLESARALALRIVAFNLAAVIVCLASLPLVALLGGGNVASHGELVRDIALFAAPVILTGPGGIFLGALEGVGRTVVAALISGLGPLIALPATVIAISAGAGLGPICAIQGFSLAAPRACAWVYWHVRPSIAVDRHDFGAERLRLRLVLQMALLSAAVLLQTGVDPLIVSSQIGSVAAASYGIGSRVVTGALIPLMVVTPMIGGNIAAARAAGWPRGSNTHLRRLVLGIAVGGAVAGTAVVLLGPEIGMLIGANRVPAPLMLYMSGGLFVFLTFVTMPLYLAFSGPTGLKRSVYLNVTLTLVNIGLSIPLASKIGPSGPLWASTITTALAGLFWLIAWRTRPRWLAEAHQRVN